MRGRLLRSIVTLVALLISVSAQAALIYESIALDDWDPSLNGGFVSSNQFIGARFEINQQAAIDGIGGNFLEDSGAFLGGSVFGAIVELDSSGHPSATRLTLDNVIASVVFTPTIGDFLAPITTTLNPGTYGVVFGSGLFGATGTQALTSWATVPSASNGVIFFSSSSQDWKDLGSIAGRRIFISSAVPIPPAVWLFGSALGLLGWMQRKSA